MRRRFWAAPGGGEMSGASRLLPAVIIATLAISPCQAADLASPPEPLPPPPPTFYVHAGAVGAFAEPNASPTGGGLFQRISNIAIRPVYTFFVEAGYFLTPEFAVAIGTAVPPLTHFKGTGLIDAPILGTDLLGSARYGEGLVLLQYHFSQFGPFQPYLGAGVGFAANFANISDGILRNFYWDQNFAFVLQMGADYMLTPNWGVFVDGKKIFFETDSGGFVTNPLPPHVLVPVRAHVRVDPWAAETGITFKY
jgi:outer membrane protein